MVDIFVKSFNCDWIPRIRQYWFAWHKSILNFII